MLDSSLAGIYGGLRRLDSSEGEGRWFHKGAGPMNIRRASIISAVAVLAARSAVAQEKKIKRSDLPSAVEKTVAAQSAGATVKGFSKETKKGQTFYEAEIVVKGHSKDILIDANGAIVEVEEEVAMDALPADVKAGLQAKQAKANSSRLKRSQRKTNLWLTKL
jgi:hypothetical protein